MNPQLRALIEELEQQGIQDKKVLKAIEKIDRKEFLIEEYKPQVYLNIALPTFNNQTISQPYTVAFMLQALELKKKDIVFEIGTGSGWNSALIAFICNKGFIYTAEIDSTLAKFAQKNTEKFNLKNLKILNIDGIEFLKNSQVNFDKIIITAASREIPEVLIKKLKNNGILILPLGVSCQKMIKIKKQGNRLVKQELGDFVFVPLREK